MEEGVECFVENVNNSRGIVIITKSNEEQKIACTEMLFKIIREIQQAKEEFCGTVTLHQYLMDSDDPTSFDDEDRLFAMSEVDSVLRNRKPSIISVSGRGHLNAVKIAHLMKCSHWGECSTCLLYTSPSPRDATLSRMPSSA